MFVIASRRQIIFPHGYKDNGMCTASISAHSLIYSSFLWNIKIGYLTSPSHRHPHNNVEKMVNCEEKEDCNK